MSTKPSVGELSVYPSVSEIQTNESGTGSQYFGRVGMTYRQRLIVEIAGHAAGSANPWECNDDGMEQLAKFTIRFADAIIERLDKERGER